MKWIAIVLILLLPAKAFADESGSLPGDHQMKNGQAAYTNKPNSFTKNQTFTTLNNLTITNSTGTLTIAAGKTVTVNNSLTFSGTDSTTMTFPASTTTVAGLSIAETWTALQTFNVAPAIYMTGSSAETDCTNQNSSTSLALNLDNGNNQCVTITGAVTITISTPTHPVKVTVVLTQDGTGHVYSITGCKWPGGSAITYSTAASKIDVISIFYDGTNKYCMGGAAFS